MTTIQTVYCIQMKNIHDEWELNGMGFSEEQKAADHCKRVTATSLCESLEKDDFESLFATFGVSPALVQCFKKARSVSEMCDYLLKIEEGHPGVIREACLLMPSASIKYTPVKVEL